MKIRVLILDLNMSKLLSKSSYSLFCTAVFGTINANIIILIASNYIDIIDNAKISNIFWAMEWPAVTE